jgi:RHS repeat-associated protein
LLSTTYSYDIASNRNKQVTGTDTFDYVIDDDGKLVRESVNRLMVEGLADMAKGELTGLAINGSGLELLPLNDSFAGDEFDCDRWRVGFLNTGSSHPDVFLGAEIRQNNGLQMRFPRGYTNRAVFLDAFQPLNDDFGATLENFYTCVQHRLPLEGDFDVQVVVDDYLGAAGDNARASLFVSQFPVEELTEEFVGISLRHNNTVAVTSSGGGQSGMALSPQTPRKLRLVRSGSTVTAYVRNNTDTAWLSQAGWIRSDMTTEPMYPILLVNAGANSCISATFKNFVFHSGGNTHSTSGTYLSAVYDAGRNVMWQNLSWQETLPSGTDIELQLAFADSELGPWSYVGPDGTSGSRFSTAAGQAVAASTISRYCRVKADFTGNGSATPRLDSLELSYAGSLSSRSVRFEFDAAGNLTERREGNDSGSLVEIRTYDYLNQIQDNEIDDGVSPVTWTYSHDDNGNLISKTDGTDVYDYIWNDQNQLVGVELNSTTVVTYEYDSKSRLLQRVEGGTTTNYHWDGWSLFREEKTGVVTEITNYLLPAGAIERDGEFFYLHGDALSSTQLVTDENGDQVGRFIYSAWGEELYASESVPGILENRFVGGLGCRRDAATGLIYMRHRWYDAQLQRFISRDPIGLKGGSNSYVYSNNNPVNYKDPMGLLPVGPVGDVLQIILPAVGAFPLPNVSGDVTGDRGSNASTYIEDGQIRIDLDPKFCSTATLNDYANILGHEYTHALQQSLGLSSDDQILLEVQAQIVQSIVGTVLRPNNTDLLEQNERMYEAIDDAIRTGDTGYLRSYIKADAVHRGEAK